jgi:histidinol-phosphate aminotransferase
MNPAELAPAAVRAMAAYQAGKPISELAREMEIDPASIIKLASNENALGIPPKARLALEEALSGLARYPDSHGFELKKVIGDLWGVSPEQIVLGNGSNDIIELVVRSFLTPGESSVFSQYSFAVYALATQSVGAEGIMVPTREFGHDLDAMLAAIRPDTRVVFVTNPNNPTGTCCPPDALLDFISKVPEDVLVVLDEAYSDFMSAELQPASLDWLSRFSNLILARTCSKAYGLAGLRVGFGLMHPDVASLLNRVRQPFNVNSLALVAAAAALQDREFLAQSIAMNRQGMVQITDALQRLGVEYIPSQANFVTFHVGRAAQIHQALLQQGIIIRSLASYDLPASLRVTVGRPEENARFIAALEAELQSH